MSEIDLDLSLPELNRRMLAGADAIREAVDRYRETNSVWVEAEREHRHARAVAQLKAKARLVADKEAEVHLLVEEEWFAAEMAKALRDSAKEELRATEAILNGLQSVASAHREEARLASWGQERSA